MEIRTEEQDSGGIIFLENEEKKEVGRLTFSLNNEDKIFIISYVMVHNQYESQGLGKILVREALKMALDKNYKIYPHCSYANSILKKMPEAESFLVGR